MLHAMIRHVLWIPFVLVVSAPFVVACDQLKKDSADAAAVAVPPATESDELALDRAAVGFTPGTHALAPLRPLLPAGTVVEVAGQAISWQRPPTARGMLFLSLTDEDGLLNVVVPPRVRERDGEAALREPLVLVRGVVERQGRSLSIRALALRPLAAILAATSQLS